MYKKIFIGLGYDHSNHSKVPFRRPVLLNFLVWIFKTISIKDQYYLQFKFLKPRTTRSYKRDIRKVHTFVCILNRFAKKCIQTYYYYEGLKNFLCNIDKYVCTRYSKSQNISILHIRKAHIKMNLSQSTSFLSVAVLIGLFCL